MAALNKRQQSAVCTMAIAYAGYIEHACKDEWVRAEVYAKMLERAQKELGVMLLDEYILMACYAHADRQRKTLDERPAP
jgi:hypothetical protein